MRDSHVCTKCHIEKPADSFSPDKSKKSGIRSHCRSCRKRSVNILDTHGAKSQYKKSKQIDWGNGRAKLVKPTGKREELVVAISDIHIPYQDTDAVEHALNLIRSIQPDTIIINGDIVDLFEISSHSKSPERWDQLQNDLDETNDFLGAVREAGGKARIYATEGNHENRLQSYLKLNAPKLMSLRSSKVPEQIRYSDYGIDYVDGEQGFLLRPEFLVQHGNIIRGEVGATAKAHITKHGISGMSGHTHRLGSYIKSGYVQRQWFEMGGLMRTDPDYAEAPNWQQGMLVLQFSNSTANFVGHLVSFVDGRMRFGLEAY